MLTKRQIRNFKNRVNQYEYVSEKEIETEFYKFISKYFENKYTKNGTGIINYTSPYNIDGLLEIRTLDHDYRILVEAKASKNYNNKKNRDEVLSQAIYYCRKLNHYGELLPAIIVLLEEKSMVIIKTEDLKNYCQEEHNGDNASNAYMTDNILIERLSEEEYFYYLIKFDHKTKFNKIFKKIEEFSYLSKFNIQKNRNFKGNKTEELVNILTKENRYKYYNGEWYIFDTNGRLHVRVCSSKWQCSR